MSLTFTPETINEPNCDCWQDLERSEKISKLWNDEILVDCTFLVGPENSVPEKITGHKVMFILESPVLEKMLTGNFIEVEKKHEIRIIDFFPKEFKNFRYMVYHNDYEKYSTFSLEETFELYRIADKYLVSSITKNCIKYWKTSYVNQTTPLDTLITLFEFAHQLSDKSLLAAINAELNRQCGLHGNLITEKINELTLDSFYDYIFILSKKRTNNLPKPVVIFKAIDCYFRRNDLIKMEEVHKTVQVEEITDEDLKKKLAFRNKILRLVKFKEMTPTEFLDGPGKSDLLGCQEKYDMISLLTRKYENKYNNNSHDQRYTEYYNDEYTEYYNDEYNDFNINHNIYNRNNNSNRNQIIVKINEKQWDKFFPEIEL